MDQNSLAQLDPVSQDDRTKEGEHSSLSPDHEVFPSNIHIYLLIYYTISLPCHFFVVQLILLGSVIHVLMCILLEACSIFFSHTIYLNFQDNERVSPVSKCFICEKSTEDDSKLKNLQKMLSTVKNVAVLRSKLTNDKYERVTLKILNTDTEGDLYHPVCYRQYTAVKRPKEDRDRKPEEKKPRSETRSHSSLPQTDKQGILKGKCVFCGKARKKKKGKEESLFAIATKEGCDTLVQRAPLSQNSHFKSLILGGVDLIAKEAEYHGSCRVQFMHETEKHDHNTATPVALHKNAFASLCSFVRMEVIHNGKVFLMSSLLELYKSEYSGNGGDSQDVYSYSSQNLTRKLESKFGNEIRIALADSRRGNYVCKASLTDEQAIATLHVDAKEYKENEKIRYAALHLRSQIMKLPKSKTPDPATVQNLKETAPEIPQQLALFFRTLLGGLTQTPQGPLERKVTSMASDAIFLMLHTEQ